MSAVEGVKKLLREKSEGGEVARLSQQDIAIIEYFEQRLATVEKITDAPHIQTISKRKRFEPLFSSQEEID